MTDLKVSSLEDIKKKQQTAEEGQVFELPSGLILKVKRPSISKLIRDKAIPGNLMAAAVRLVSGNNANNNQELTEGIQLMENIVHQCILEPQGISLEDVSNFSDDDKAFLYLYIQKGVTDLQSFRNEQREQVARLSGQALSESPTK